MQNLFCEIDKYARVAYPQFSGLDGRSRIKQRFQPSAGGTAAVVSAEMEDSWGGKPVAMTYVDARVAFGWLASQSDTTSAISAAHRYTTFRAIRKSSFINMSC